MQVVVPAAGEGTRLGSRTDDRPKALVEVAGEPLLAHTLRSVLHLEPEEAIVVVRSLGGAVRERFGDAFEGLPLRYARQRRPSGLAHAVLVAEPLVHRDFLVIQGDNVHRSDLRPAVERHRSRGLDALVLTEEVSPSEARQAVCVTGPDGALVRILEHPDEVQRRLGRIVAGVFVFSPLVFDACREVRPSEEGEYELTDAVNLLLDRTDRRVEAMPLEGSRVNVNTPDDLRRAEELIRCSR